MDTIDAGESTGGLPSIDPTPATGIVDDLIGGIPDPTDPTGVRPPRVITDPLDSILPPNVITDPDPDGNTNGGGPTGGTTGGGATSGGRNASSPGSLLRPGANTVGDPSRIATDSARLGSTSLGGALRFEDVAERAMRLAGPMAAPIGIAIAGVLGLVMLAKSSGKLDGLENEKEALGGWTVIRL